VRRGLSPELHRPAKRGWGGGFTLLEVMVALAILAGSLVAISEVVGGALRNHVRARQLDVATSLARAKMVELQAQYERKGFRDLDESDEGSFEADGHPEVRWKVDVRRPSVELGPDAVLGALTGGKSLQDLMPPPDQAPQLAPFQALITASLQGLLTRIGEQLKKGVRELRLTVSWQGAAAVESFDVVTHLVVLEPEER
jgi:general secretion pathway protein I